MIEAGGLLERYAADEDDVVGDAELVNERVQLGHVLPVTLGADDDELASCELVTRQLPGAEAGRRQFL